MTRNNELAPNDPQNVTGSADTADGRGSGDDQKSSPGGEYEPKDSRNVTGTAATPDGHWTNDEGKAVAERRKHSREVGESRLNANGT